MVRFDLDYDIQIKQIWTTYLFRNTIQKLINL